MSIYDVFCILIRVIKRLYFLGLVYYVRWKVYDLWVIVLF